QHYKSLNDYVLLPLKLSTNLPNELLRLIINKLSISVSIKDLTKIELLNEDQKLVFNTVIEHIEMNLLVVIFIDRPAGSGKTFLYLCLLAKVHLAYSIALAMALSGIATLLMSGGQTAHPRFKIPLNINSTSTCSIKALNKTLQDIMTVISYSEKKSSYLSKANEFKNFLLRIGNGTEKTINNDMICIPNQIIINWHDEQLLQTLIEQIYLILDIGSSNTLHFTDKAILTTKNEYVDYINNTILN
ncbi:14191_t:CDS:2, partial [Gigaspora margarita]